MHHLIIYGKQMLRLTQRSTRSVLELALSLSLVNGSKKSRHLVTEALQAIGATALHGLQLSSVGINGPLEPFQLSPFK